MTVNDSDMKPAWNDPDDAPELTDAWFDRAHLVAGGPDPAGSPKEAVMITLDKAALDRLRDGGPGWQARINEAVRKAAGL